MLPTPQILEIRAATGALVLTLRRGNRWWEEVNADILDQESIFDCVLGQLYGNYGYGLEKLGITEAQAEKFGFFLRVPHPLESEEEVREFDQTYAALTDAWVKVIKRLNENASV